MRDKTITRKRGRKRKRERERKTYEKFTQLKRP